MIYYMYTFIYPRSSLSIIGSHSAKQPPPNFHLYDVVMEMEEKPSRLVSLMEMNVDSMGLLL